MQANKYDLAKKKTRREIMREKIKNQQSLELPFVVYCKPNTTSIIGLFQNNNQLYEARDFTEKGFVFASFDGTLTHLIPANQCEKIEIDKDDSTGYSMDNTIFQEDAKAKTEFKNLVKQGIEAIHHGKFKKVVLSRKEEVTVASFDLAATFYKLLQLYPTAFVYCFYHPKIGTWLGATPEQLLKVNGAVFETIALAGTQKDKGFADVVWEEKEQKEQQIVTEYIVRKIEKKVVKLKVTQPYSIKAGNIWHIRTDISGVLNSETNFQELVNLLHPTPAVCGLPKEDAKAFIVENEHYNRSFYTGYLGELNTSTVNGGSSADLYVNLRSMQIEKNTAYLYIGCGITKDSDTDKEWEESVNKSMTMKRVL
jgi:isochorismate synthase